MTRPAAALSRSRRHPARLLVLVLALGLALPLSGGTALADAHPNRAVAPGTADPGAGSAGAEDPGAETTDADLQRAAEAVRSADEQVAAMQQQVEETATVLSEGSARLEQGRARLEQTQAEQAVAETAAAQALQRAVDAKTKVAVVVGAAYRSPVPQTVQMALTAGPDEIVDVIVARHALDRVQGDSQDLLRRATLARAEADQARRYAAEVTRAAAEQERALAAEVDRLAAVAQRSEQTLAAAAAALSEAKVEQERVLATAAAEAQARVREAEARARAESAERLARSAAGSYIVATCAGQPAGPQANGMLDPATLCPLDDAPGHALRPDAATAFNALNAAHKAERGRPLCVGDSYRSYAAQVAVYASKPALAAVPGRSNHGWGLAVDLSCGVERFGSPDHEWMRANAGRFGWFHPAWAQAGGSRPEAWHWEFAAGQ